MALEIQINFDPFRRRLEIYAYRVVNGNTIAVVEPLELPPIKLKSMGMDDMFAPMEPTLTLDGELAMALFPALEKFLDERRGYNPQKSAKVEAALEATKYHLEDLRHLLKLPKEGKQE